MSTNETLPRWSVFVGESSLGKKFYVPTLLHVHAPVEPVEVRSTQTGGAYVYVSTDSVTAALEAAARFSTGVSAPFIIKSI